MKRLEIGPGDHPLPGFDRLDMIARTNSQFVARWGDEPLPFPDDTYDEVYASHVLEHVPWFKTQDALREVRRILKPGGLFEVWVPNFGYLIECYQSRRCGDDWRRFNPSGDPMLWLNGRLFTYGPGEENWHRACFDRHSLCECLAKAGFTDVEVIPARSRGTSHGRIDLGVLGRVG